MLVVVTNDGIRIISLT